MQETIYDKFHFTVSHFSSFSEMTSGEVLGGISFSIKFLYMLGRFMTQIHRGNLYRASYITYSHYQMLTLNPVLINCSKEAKS